jgi:hypothetical protein
VPYDRSVSNLDPVISRAFEDESILDSAADVELSADELRAMVTEKTEAIFEAAGPGIRQYDLFEQRHASESSRVTVQRFAYHIRRVGLILLLLCPIIFLGYVYFYGFVNATAFALSRGPLATVGALLLVYILSYTVYVRAGGGLTLFMSEAMLGGLIANLGETKEEIEKNLLEAVKEECREIFEKRSVPSYSTELRVDTGRVAGLAEVPGTSRAVNTTARLALRKMLEMMPGGSVGVAGPRGAGKTTLLWDYCFGAVEKIQGRPVLGVMTSAPVEYEARDFILYIFLSVCRAALKRCGADPDAPPWVSEARGPLALSYWARARLRVLAVALSAPAALLLITGFYALSYALSAEEKAAGARSYIPLPVLLANTLGLTAGQLLGWGLFFLAASLSLLFLFSPAKPMQRLGSKFDGSSPGLSGQSRALYVRKAWEWVKMIKFQQSFTSGWSGALKLPVGLEGNTERAASLAENQKSLPEIVGGLREFLEELSADFQIVIGIDELDKIESDEAAQRFVNEIKSVFGLRRCFYLVSVSESAMSNFERRGVPFRDAFDSSFDNIIRVDYLTLEAAKGLIARRIVGMSVPFRCLCYCVSGGLARDLIRACRSLISLAEGKPDTPARLGLSDLCASLVRQDVKSKVQAVITSASKIELEPEGPEFIAALYSLEGALDNGRSLTPECAGLRVSLARVLSADKEEAKMLAARRLKLVALGKELAVYVYYADTLLRFFGSEFDEQKLEAAELAGGHGSLNYLARARQSLGVNPAITKSMIDDFRTACGMGLPPESAEEPLAAPRAAGGPHDGNGPNGLGPSAAAFIAKDLPAALQKSVEGLKEILDRLVVEAEG